MKSQDFLLITAVVFSGTSVLHPSIADGVEGVSSANDFYAAGCAAHGCASLNSNLQGLLADDEESEDSMSPGSEAQFVQLLKPENREIYQRLNPEGKALARQLSGEQKYRDPNLAVIEAARRARR